MLRNSTSLTQKDGNNSRGIPEQQGDSSELSRNPSTEKPRQQRGTNMDGKFQEIMDMPYNLMSRMATPNGRMPLIIDLEIEQIKEY